MGHVFEGSGADGDGPAPSGVVLGRILPCGAVLVLASLMGFILAACSSGSAPVGEENTPLPSETAETTPDTVSTALDASAPDTDGEATLSALAVPSPDDDGTYLLFNQRLIEGFTSDPINLVDPETVFRRVFQGLPAEVTVFPSENYYYFILNEGGRQVWGNIRLPAGQRELGILSFGYFEFIEFPTATTEKFTGSKFFDATDGVLVREVDPTTYDVTFEGKSVTFHLHELDPPPSQLGAAFRRNLHSTHLRRVRLRVLSHLQ